MNFLTLQQYLQLQENGQPENIDQDHWPVVKLILPRTDCVWLLSKYDSVNRKFYGLCDGGDGFPELGHVALDYLNEATGFFGQKIEQDVHFKPLHPLSVYANAALVNLRIVESAESLIPFANPDIAGLLP